jgi:hypothetical protein
MARVHDSITPDLRAFIEAQRVFFVASAPLAADGHVNLSPKGLDSLRVLGDDRVAYLDLTGSGNETSAHLAENGRITIMVCAFEGPPRILRLFGTGRVMLPGDDGWDGLAAEFPEHVGTRQIIDVAVERVQTSCGFGVPRMEFVGERDQLPRWAAAKGEDGLIGYRREKNARSIDGLPARAG